MDAEVLRAAFRIAFIILALALVTLPFQDPAKPEFYVTILAAAVGCVFVGVVIALARWSTPRPPAVSDKRLGKHSNSGEGQGRNT